MRRTKIVCTIGPATATLPKMKKLLRAGMNVARLNFSHGTHEQHASLIKTIRTAAREVGVSVAILQDLQGPRIRLGEIDPPVKIVKGDVVTLYPEMSSSEGTGKSFPQQYAGLAQDVKKGSRILIADGAIELHVEQVNNELIKTRVKQGGMMKSHKGLNAPGVSLSVGALTKKDKEDIIFGLAQKVDFITLSFVKSGRDMQTLRKYIEMLRPQHMPQLVAKVERPEAIDDIEGIVQVSDAVMLGRGDLALEADPAKLVVMQERVIEVCLQAGKPVITATQMLETMTENLQPTRAELSDIGHAVVDHTDATMLSGETASGKYPVETVNMMDAVIRETEKSKYDDVELLRFGRPKTPTEALAFSIAVAAKRLEIDAVLIMPVAMAAFPVITRLRPEVILIPVVPTAEEARAHALRWGAYPVVAGAHARPKNVIRSLHANRQLKKKDRIIVIECIPSSRSSVDAAMTCMRHV